MRLLHWQRCLLFPWQQQKILQDRLRVLVYMCLKAQKKDGTVTFIKKWKDNKDNNERDVPDIEISTEKPEGMIVKYKVTFHGNGLTFADGTSDNEMVYTSNGQIVDGQYKVPVGTNVCWYADTSYKTRVTVLKT